MIDKQIIIDGVDVSGCPHYIHKDGSCSSHDCECVKCVHNVCFYKDYKAKEQECDELKKGRDTLSVTRTKLLDDLWIAEDNLKDYIEHYNKASDELDQLKAENDELKSLLKVRIEDLCDSCGASSMKLMPCKVYEKTLTEIKEISERDKEFCIKCNGDKEMDCIDCIEGGRALLAKDILQKISEVIDG